MFRYKYSVFTIICLIFMSVNTQKYDILANLLNSEIAAINSLKKADLLLMGDKMRPTQQDKVEINLYYECFCPDCRIFDTMHFKPTVEKLASYLNLNVYPYGNAKTINKSNGQYEFICQHGPGECYGNKLHACAIDYIGNITKAVFFNACMMDSSQKNRGSDDEAADQCGIIMNINTTEIKQCAKGRKGSTLLKYYGDESQKVGYKYVPYILINGQPNDGSNFLKDVCAAFRVPPPECQSVNVIKRK